MLSQHIGAPATPSVKKGDVVNVGTVIGTAQEGKLSVNIHSSIDGKVTNVTDKFIKIKR